MRRRALIAVLAASAIVVAACGTDTTGPAASSDAASPAAGSAVDGTADPILGQWIGEWKSNGESRQAVLNIGAVRPLRATIDIPGRCGADWAESSRTGERIDVDATVTYGACSDNRWVVVLAPTLITATDPDSAANSLRFTRQ